MHDDFFPGLEAHLVTSKHAMPSIKPEVADIMCMAQHGIQGHSRSLSQTWKQMLLQEKSAQTVLVVAAAAAAADAADAPD